jgi:Protein of unknown function (DUF3455)
LHTAGVLPRAPIAVFNRTLKESFMQRTLISASLAAAAFGLSACAVAQMAPPATMFKQDALPDAVKVPAGNKVVLETVGVGEITYECRDKKDAAGQFEWVFVGPAAVLNDRAGKVIGSYYGPPATWQSSDGSNVTATQLAVSPAGAGNIPLQLVKANPASGAGAMMGVTYIQRVATKGGVAPASTCDAASKGKKEIVKYQADYIFWKAA